MKIAILSNGPGNYSTKRLKEEALKRGHQVRIVKYKDCHASIEQSNPIVRYKGEILTGYDAIIPRIASNMTRYGTAIVRQFEMQGVYPLNERLGLVSSLFEKVLEVGLWVLLTGLFYLVRIPGVQVL